jgi:hypothetical protein
VYFILSFPLRSTCSSHFTLLNLIILIIPHQKELWNSALCIFQQPSGTVSLLHANIHNTSSQKPSFYVLNLISETKLHIIQAHCWEECQSLRNKSRTSQ